MQEWSWEVTQQFGTRQFNKPWYVIWDAKDLLKALRKTKVYSTAHRAWLSKRMHQGHASEFMMAICIFWETDF